MIVCTCFACIDCWQEHFLRGEFFKFFAWSAAVQLQQHTMALAAPSDQSDSFGMAARMNLPWQKLSHDMTCEGCFVIV